MELKAHPVIEELLVNENGTEFIYKGETLKIHVWSVREGENFQRKRVCILNQTIPVAKLVCEAFNGMRLDKSYSLHRKDFNPDNNHYSNLFWAKGSRLRTKKTKRPKNSKISDKDIPEIVRRIKAKEASSVIAASYAVSPATINRVKVRYVTEPLNVLRECVVQAENIDAVHDACARYLNFESKADAVSKMGNFEFFLEVDKLLKQL